MRTWYECLSFGAEAVHPLSAYHAGYSDGDERDAEELPHVDQHAWFEAFLHVFSVLDDKAEREYQRKTESEEKACADLFGPLSVEIPAYQEEQGIGYSLVKLPGMARYFVYPFEDERPRNIGNLADNLAVH